MGIECSIITALFVVIVVVFFRKKRKFWAYATLPLTLVPFTEFVFDLLLYQAIHIQVGPYGRILALLVAVAGSCAWIGAVSGGIKNNKKRVTYIGITNLFNILLAAILVHNILSNEVNLI